MRSKNVRIKTGKALLSGRYRDPAHPFSLGWARLYRDRIVFYRFTWRGWYRDTILLEDVARVQWWAGESYKVNFVLHLHDDTTIKIWIARGGLWKYEVEACLDREDAFPFGLSGRMASAA